MTHSEKRGSTEVLLLYPPTPERFGELLSGKSRVILGSKNTKNPAAIDPSMAATSPAATQPLA
ncbi:MAG: hypothetical protein WCH77_12420 [Planctomycetota bacterium]